MAPLSLDESRCTRCGACVAVCPTGSLAADAGAPPRPVGALCIGCGHCAAVCPVEAITVADLAPDWGTFETFAMDRTWLPPGQADVGLLVRLMASRRSCRSFTERPVALAVLRDLVKVAALAPSATNSQRWTFTLVPDRPSVAALAERCAEVYRRLNRLARSRVLRTLLRWSGRPELAAYEQRYREFFERRLAAWASAGRDFLFWGAPAVVVIGSSPGGSHPADDALLAAQNLLLAAHAMGLGTCLAGVAEAAMRHDPSVARGLGLAADEACHAVVAVGYPASAFRRMTGRARPLTRVWRAGA